MKKVFWEFGLVLCSLLETYAGSPSAFPYMVNKGGIGTNITFWGTNGDAAALTIRAPGVEPQWKWTPNTLFGYDGGVQSFSLSSSGDMNTSGDIFARSFYDGSATRVRVNSARAVAASNIWDSSNARYWGAAGDGPTDDTAALQLLLSQGGDLKIPAGRYSLNSQYQNNVTNYHYWPTNLIWTALRLTNNTHVDARGAEFIIQPTTNGWYGGITIMDVSNVTWTGGTVFGDRSDSGSRSNQHGYGMVIAGCSNVLVDQFRSCSNWGDGLMLAGGNFSQNQKITVRDSTFDWNRRNGITVGAGTDVLVDHVTCINMDDSGTEPKAGIDIEAEIGPSAVAPGWVNLAVTNISIINSRFSNCRRAVGVFGSKPIIGVNIENNTIDGCTNGLDFGGFSSTEKLVFRNNIVRDCYQNLALFYMTNAIIEGNTFADWTYQPSQLVSNSAALDLSRNYYYTGSKAYGRRPGEVVGFPSAYPNDSELYFKMRGNDTLGDPTDYAIISAQAADVTPNATASLLFRTYSNGVLSTGMILDYNHGLSAYGDISASNYWGNGSHLTGITNIGGAGTTNIFYGTNIFVTNAIFNGPVTFVTNITVGGSATSTNLYVYDTSGVLKLSVVDGVSTAFGDLNSGSNSVPLTRGGIIQFPAYGYPAGPTNYWDNKTLVNTNPGTGKFTTFNLETQNRVTTGRESAAGGFDGSLVTPSGSNAVSLVYDSPPLIDVQLADGTLYGSNATFTGTISGNGSGVSNTPPSSTVGTWIQNSNQCATFLPHILFNTNVVTIIDPTNGNLQFIAQTNASGLTIQLSTNILAAEEGFITLSVSNDTALTLTWSLTNICGTVSYNATNADVGQVICTKPAFSSNNLWRIKQFTF